MTESLWILFRTRNVSDTNAKKIKTHFVFLFFFNKKSCHFCENVEKYGTAGQATDDIMVYASCMLYN